MQSRKELRPRFELFDFSFSPHRIQDLHAFHSLEYFHTSFVSRYSSLLHTTRLFLRGNILGYGCVGRFAPAISRAKEKQPGQLQPLTLQTFTTAAHTPPIYHALHLVIALHNHPYPQVMLWPPARSLPAKFTRKTKS